MRGLAALREAVAEYHRRRQGITRTGAQVLIGPGSKELMFLLPLVYHGDLLIPLPAWVSYAPQAEILGRPVCRIPTRRENDWKLPPDELERICASHADRPRLLLLNTPHNPTGHSYSREELTAIADVARRHRLVVLSDEIYAELLCHVEARAGGVPSLRALEAGENPGVRSADCSFAVERGRRTSSRRSPWYSPRLARRARKRVYSE